MEHLDGEHMRHPETNHEMSAAEHEERKDLLEEAHEHAKEFGPEHHLTILEGLKKEHDEYEPCDENEELDEEEKEEDEGAEKESKEGEKRDREDGEKEESEDDAEDDMKKIEKYVSKKKD